MLSVKEIRNKLGLTQEELALKTGIPRDRIAKWEQGKSSPKTDDYLILNKVISELDDTNLIIGTNIRKIREYLDVTERQLGQELSASEEMMKSYESGKSRPTDKAIRILSSYSGISEDILLQRIIDISEIKCSKFLGDEIRNAIELPKEVVLGDYSKNPNQIKFFPKMEEEEIQCYFPNVNAAAGLDFLTSNENDKIPIKLPNVDARYFINVFGDSMYPKYCSGEIIGIKEIEKEMVFFGHAYVIEMEDGEAYLKYIKKGKSDEYWNLASENKKYEPKEFHLSKVRKVFIIKAVITKTTLI